MMINSPPAMGYPKRLFSIRNDELPADLDTPVSAFLKLRSLGAAFLLESAEGVDRLGRYSFIGFKSGSLSGSQDQFSISPDADSDPLLHIKRRFESFKIEYQGELPALLGAAVGYIGFDYVHRIENLPLHLVRETGFPVCEFFFVESLVVFDHLARKMSVFSLVEEENPDTIRRHDEVITVLKSFFSYPGKPKFHGCLEFSADMTGPEYMDIVRQAQKYIHEGDVFQVVLSRKLETECDAEAFEVYRALRMLNPSPYMFYLDFGERQIVGSSPEILVKLKNRKALISPIAGTRARGLTPGEDVDLERDLLADAKERAEHIMLVDLARNDIGKVSRFNSISVGGFMRIERFSHVMHIVSDVSGDLREGTDQFDLFRAAFPAGTVSGAPKVRAMEIIEELEKTSRGIYAGAVGYFSPTGDMDTCITIRTLVFSGRSAVLRAGAGIVADSDPRKELAEIESKMAALKAALESAGVTVS